MCTCSFISTHVNVLPQMTLESMLVYPNKMDFPVMENFGKSPPPLGMIEVTVIRAEGLRNVDFLGKSDPYVKARIPHLPRPPLHLTGS